MGKFPFIILFIFDMKLVPSVMHSRAGVEQRGTILECIEVQKFPVSGNTSKH